MNKDIYMLQKVLVDDPNRTVVVMNLCGHLAVVSKYDEYCFVLNLSRITKGKRGTLPHVSKLDHFDMATKAYDKMLHIIGKLSLKKVTSKYFANPCEEEDMVNGNCPDDQFPYALDRIVEVTKILRENGFWNVQEDQEVSNA